MTEIGPTDGTPVVFLHGISGTRLAFDRQLHSPLARALRLVSVDLRGHGESDKPRDAYGPSETWAGDIAAVVEALGLDRPVFVGWSYGGLVVCDYLAAVGPAATRGVVFISAATSLGPAAAEHMSQRFAALGRPICATDSSVLIPALEELVETMTAQPLPLRDRLMMLGASVRVPSHVRRALLTRRLDHTDLLPGLDVPALVVHGAADAVFGVGLSERLVAQLPNATLAVHPKAGHAPFLEDPEWFNAALLDFLSGLG